MFVLVVWVFVLVVWGPVQGLARSLRFSCLDWEKLGVAWAGSLAHPRS